MSLLPPWFSKRRSLALGLATSGVGFGGFAFNLITGRLISSVGILWAWRILGYICIAGNTICALLFREYNSLTGSNNTTASVYKPRYSVSIRQFLHTQTLLVLAWGFITELGYVSLWYILPTYGTSIGLTPTQGSVVQAIMNLSLGLGRPVLGYYSDLLGRINTALSAHLLSGVLCLTVWIFVRSYPGLLVFAALAGPVSSIFWSTVNPILAEVVKIDQAASAFGAICFSLVLPATFGVAISLQMVKGHGIEEFLPSQIYIGITFLVGASFLWCLRAWKLFDVEKRQAAECHSAPEDTEIAGRVSMVISNSSFWLTPKRLFLLERA